jgi:hypothetical protein
VRPEPLWQAWSVRKRAVAISPALYLSPDGLALGAGTILLAAEGPRRLAKTQGEEARILALLSAAYGRAIAPSVLGNIERAAKSWGAGDAALAAIHLVHAALPRPDDPDEAARRLFITDAFVKAGTNPFAILRALDLESSYVEAVEKLYNPLQPRVPAGSGRTSGRWTKIGSLLADLTASQVAQLGLWAARLLGPAAIVSDAVEVFRTIFVPSDNRISVEGDIDGLPGGHYSWNRDEAQLRITYETADGELRTFSAQRKDDKFLGPDEQVVGVVLPDDNVLIDADALPGRPANDNEPKLCPRPQPDKRTNNKGIGYEAFMRPLVNPFMPTPLGLAYYLLNPSTGRAVEFDDREQTTGTMIDYKDQYWELLTSDISEFIIAKLKKEALRQIAAAGPRGIRWYFSEKEAADFVRDLFRDDPNIRNRIVIEDRPFPGIWR